MHDLDTALSAREVFDGLDADIQELVLVNDAIYKGSWDDFAEDVRRRQAGRPYLFTIDLPVEDLLGWIDRLRDYETVRGEPFARILSGEEHRWHAQ